jgi:hypothetical protein
MMFKKDPNNIATCGGPSAGDCSRIPRPPRQQPIYEGSFTWTLGAAEQIESRVVFGELKIGFALRKQIPSRIDQDVSQIGIPGSQVVPGAK